MFDMFLNNLMWREGLPLLGIVLFLFIIGFRFFRPLMYSSFLLSIGFFYFFRNPERCCVEALRAKNVIVCPADGTVMAIERGGDLPDGYASRIALFLSPLDVHVNWVPIGGIIDTITYRPGKFLFASNPESATGNERNEVVIKTVDGYKVMVHQIAGILASKICCWVVPGQYVHGAGSDGIAQKFGMIKFGSRTEIFLPPNATISKGIHVGDQVYGGQTVVGMMT